MIGFLKTLLYLASDFLLEMTNNVNIRRYITLADVISSFTWAFLFLVSFGVSVHNYNKVKSGLSSSTKSTVQGSIAFMFICIGGFVSGRPRLFLNLLCIYFRLVWAFWLCFAIDRESGTDSARVEEPQEEEEKVRSQKRRHIKLRKFQLQNDDDDEPHCIT